MMPLTYYQRLDSKYRHIFDELNENLKNANVGLNHELLKSFAELYMMPWQYWESALGHKNYYGDKHYMHLLSLYQFFYPRADDELLWDSQEYFEVIELMNHRRSQTMKRQRFKNATESFRSIFGLLIYDLQVPHCDLKESWKLYEKNICSTPTKNIVDTYQKMSKLYDKIISAEDDDEKWFKALIETNNILFIQQNFEYRLGGDLTNKKLWKLYIEYLRENDIETMLQTYSKYCRFFLDDKEMFEEYREEVERHGTITRANVDWWNYFKSFFFKLQPALAVPWKNVFDFEIYDENKTQNYNYKFPEFKEVKPQPQPLKIHFTPKNAVSQNFVFRDTFINYIQKNANGELQQKLKMSCKYFHIKFSITVVYKLIFDTNWNKKGNECFGQSIKIVNDEINLEKIYVTTMLKFARPSSASNALSYLLPKMYKCTAKYIFITGQNLTLKEFEFIVGHGEVFDLCLLKVKIFKSKNKAIMFEELLKLVPKIEDLIISQFDTASETTTKFIDMPFKNKFKTLSLKLDENFKISAAELFKFLKKNACSSCKIYLNLKQQPYMLKYFQREMDAIIHNFWSGKEKPFFKALSFETPCKVENL